MRGPHGRARPACATQERAQRAMHEQGIARA